MRGAIWALCALALAFVIWWFAFDEPPAAPRDEDVVSAPTEEKAPSLSLSGGNFLPVASEFGSTLTYDITGQVVDASGDPLPGVLVVVRTDPREDEYRAARSRRVAIFGTEDPSPTVTSAITDAEGRFRTADLPPRAYGGYLVHAVVAPPRASSYAMAYPKFGAAPLRVVVSHGAPLHGRVVDRNDVGVSAWVHAKTRGWHSENETFVPPLRTARDGRFVFPAVAPGPLNVSVHVPGHGGILDYAIRAPRAEELVLRFDVTGAATLRGTVRDTAGQPIAGAAVEARVTARSGAVVARTMTSGSDGSYALAGFPAGELRVSVAAPGFVDRTDLGAGRRLAAGSSEVVDVLLVRAATLTGRVLTPDGEPIIGAHVAFVPGVEPHDAHVLNAVRTDSNGAYRIEGLAPVGPGRLLAEALGFYQPRPEKLINREYGHIDFGERVSIDHEGQRVAFDLTLSPGIPLAGVVRRHDGTGIGGVRLSFKRPQDFNDWDPWADVATYELVSDDAGQFRHRGLPTDSTWVVSTQQAGFVSKPKRVTVPYRATLEPIVLVMDEGATVKGHVVSTSAAPATGVAVHVGDTQCWSDGRGRFEVTGLTPGTHEVTTSSGDVGTTEVTVTWGEVVQGLRLEVTQPRRRVLAGVVVDEAGEPVPNHIVRCTTRSETGDHWDSEATDTDGRFRFENVGEGRLRLTTPGLSPSLRLDELRTDLRLVIDSPDVFIARGRVFGPDGTPAAAGSVMIWVEEGSGGSGFLVRLADGEFRHELPGATKVNVEVESLLDVLGQPIAFVPLDALDVNTDEPVEIRLEAGKLLSGVVVDEQGTPVPDVIVAALGPERGSLTVETLEWGLSARLRRRTDQDGRFVFSALPDGDLKVSAFPTPDFSTPEPVDAKPGDSNVRIVLAAAGRISGTVTSVAGVALADVSVKAYFDEPEQVFKARSDAQGHFEIRGLTPAFRYAIEAGTFTGEAGDFLRTLLEGVAVGREDLVLRMRAGARVRGSVVTEDGSPVRNAVSVRVGKSAGDILLFNHSESDGTFDVGPFEPGVYVVMASSSGDWGQSKPVEVRAPSDDVRLVLPRGFPIRGTVEGLDQSGFFVAFIVDKEDEDADPLEADGHFVFSQNEERTVTVYVHKDDDPRYALRTDIHGRAEVTLTLQQGKSIEGRIVGVPIEKNMKIQATQDGKVASGSVNEDGTYRIQGLPDGAWTVYVHGSKTLEVRKDVPVGSRDIILNIAPPDAPPSDRLPAPHSCGSCGGSGGS